MEFANVKAYLVHLHCVDHAVLFRTAPLQFRLKSQKDSDVAQLHHLAANIN